MKHTLHKWGGNISSIYDVIGPLQKITARLGKKAGKLGTKLGQFPSEGGGVPLSQLFVLKASFKGNLEKMAKVGSL